MGAVKFGSGTFPSHSRHAKYILCMNPNESRFLSCISPVNLFYKTIERFAQNIKIEMILVKLNFEAIINIADCKGTAGEMLLSLKTQVN